MIVYVVAWHYNGGGGFNWYYTPDAATRSFAVEKLNETDPTLSKDGWTVYRFTHYTEFDSEDAITREIDAELIFQEERARRTA